MTKSSTTGPFIRLLDASAGVLTQPKGSVPRLSNLIGSKRGSLRTCDGSALVNAYNGVPTLGRGKAMCEFFYEPAQVAPYYLRIMKALDQHLGAPQNLAATLSAGGSLTSGQAYFYKVTALDGVGGETTASTEATATPSGGNLSVTLTWNVVPNAISYNVYRSLGTGTEGLLIGTGLPVSQPAIGTTTVTFIDSGIVAASTIVAVSSISAESPFSTTYLITLVSPLVLQAGVVVTYVAGSNPTLNHNYTVAFNLSNNVLVASGPISGAGFTSSSGGTISYGTGQLPPATDTTQQTGLYAMPPAVNGIGYDNSNLVALFPADLPIEGNPGGGGGNPSQGGGQGSTPSGGIAGNVSAIPQIVQFTNQAVLALGNGFPPHVYSDPNGTITNPAKIVAISAIAVDANGVVTITTAAPHGINTTQGIGANVIIAGVTISAYNGNGQGASTFPTIAIPDATHVKIVNISAIGAAASSGGTLTVSTIPIISTFTPAYPSWTTAVSYSVNSIIQPATPNGHYYIAVQGGTSGGSTPTFPTGTGQRVADGSVIWQEKGLVNTAAPPPPGAAHIAVYSGSLWVLNTSVATTTNGLDGPSSLRMSDVNNLNSWNPINQAFLDKDDGLDGYGLASFTISAQGIPPEGSLIAFKRYQMYQIIGVFGANNFAIQRVLSDMGTIAPRTIQFIPGFGLGRLAHLGIAIYDGVNDRVISEPIRPYLFPYPNDLDLGDIQGIDQQWMSVSQGTQTSNPPMAVFAVPVGNSGGGLTRICCYDLALKGWAIVDLPFSISTMTQVRTAVSQPVTLMGSFSDGTLQRWQAGDQQWATKLAGNNAPGSVAWSVQLPSSATKVPDQRLYCRRVVVTGQVGQGGSTMAITPGIGGVYQETQRVTLPVAIGYGSGIAGYGATVSADFTAQAGVGVIDRRFDAIVNGIGQVTIDGFNVDVEPKPVGVPAGMIS